MTLKEKNIFADYKEEDYAALPHLSASKLRSLSLYPPRRARKDLQKTDFGKDLSFGRLLHLVLLEPEKAELMLRVVPEQSTKGVSHKNYMAAKRSEFMAQGKYPVIERTYNSLMNLKDITLANQEIKEIIEQAQKEITLVWHDEYHEIDGKARLDLLGTEHIYDVKTAAGGVLQQNFKRSIMRMGYLIQAKWYQRAVLHNYEKLMPVSFIVVDPENSAVRLHKLSEADMLKGEELMNKAIKTWKHCTRNKTWPNHFIF